MFEGAFGKPRDLSGNAANVAWIGQQRVSAPSEELQRAFPHSALVPDTGDVAQLARMDDADVRRTPPTLSKFNALAYAVYDASHGSSTTEPLCARLA